MYVYAVLREHVQTLQSFAVFFAWSQQVSHQSFTECFPEGALLAGISFLQSCLCCLLVLLHVPGSSQC
jgi:hypothetical protein